MINRIQSITYKSSGYIKSIFDWLNETITGKILLSLMAASLIFRWFYYIDKYSVNLLFFDMWSIYAPFFTGDDGWLQLFTWQHGPHRQGIGFILTKYIDQISNWNTRWIAFTIGILLISAAYIYMKLKEKLFERFNFIDVIIVFIVLMPVQYGLFANTPNISHGAAPAILLPLLCYCWLIKDLYLRYTLVVIVNFLLIYSGFGFLIGILTPLMLSIDGWFYRKDRLALRIIAAAILFSILAFGSFFINYRFNETANSSFEFPHDKPLEYFEYMFRMMANAISSEPYAGAIAMLICIVVGLYHFRSIFRRDQEVSNYQLSRTILLLLLFSFLFLLSTSVGRVSIGMKGALASRYTTYLLPAVIAIYFHICHLKLSYYKVLAPLCLVFLLVKTTFIHYEVGMMKNFSNSKKAWKEKYLESGNFKKAAEVSSYGIHQDASEEWLMERLNFLEENHLNLFLDKEE